MSEQAIGDRAVGDRAIGDRALATDVDPVPSLAGAATVPVAARSVPKVAQTGPVQWLRANLFSGWLSTAVTLLLGYLVIRFAISVIDWGFLRAVWSVPMGANGLDTSVCQASADGSHNPGACWAVIPTEWRLMTFWVYPHDQQWRPGLCIALFIGLYAISTYRPLWRRELAYIWLGTMTLILALMWGGFAGMPYVSQTQWGGLPLTLLLATVGLVLAFPLAVLVALGRRSKGLPAVRMLCVGYVELIRGVPLVTVLFMGSFMFPLVMPRGLNPDVLLRAQVAVILFAAAYLAEVIRGGLQALPKGQAEAADALGLSYWKKTLFITLPQALRLVIPPLVNTFIGFFKDTSLVLIIGLYDFLGSSKLGFAEQRWQPYSAEVYIVVAFVYFVFCYTMSRYSRGLERSYRSASAR